MKFVDMSNKSKEEIQQFEKILVNEGKKEITGFFHISQFCQLIQNSINNNDFNCFAQFNGSYVILEQYDKMDEDALYMFITGRTKKQFYDEHERMMQEYKKEQEKWGQQADLLVPEYIKKGHNVLDKKYWELWDKCVPIRLHDLYHGMELDHVLQIIKMSNCNATFQEIEKKFSEQGHSYMSYSLTRMMFKELCDRGKQFYQWSVSKEK